MRDISVGMVHLLQSDAYASKALGMAVELWGNNVSAPVADLGDTIRRVNIGKINQRYGKAGLFTSGVEHISVDGGNVERCFDVGFDIEGSRNVTVNNAIGIDCANGGLTTYYAAENITFNDCQSVITGDYTDIATHKIGRVFSESSAGHNARGIEFNNCHFVNNAGDYKRELRLYADRRSVALNNCYFKDVFVTGVDRNDDLKIINPTVSDTINDGINTFNIFAPGIRDGWCHLKGGTYQGSGHGIFVATLAVNAGGSGYVDADLEQLFEIAGTATANGQKAVGRIDTVSGGAVTAVSLVTPGAYTSAPASPNTVTALEGLTITGTGLTCTLTTTNQGVGIQALVMVDGGAAYSASDQLTLSGGTSTTASTLKVKTESSGVITSAGFECTHADIAWKGSGYAASDTVAFSSGANPGIDLTGSINAEFTVSSVDGSGGVTGLTATTGGEFDFLPATIYSASITSGSGTGLMIIPKCGTYQAIPDNPVSVTGGTGSGAEFNIIWGGSAILFNRNEADESDLQSLIIDDWSIKGAPEAISLRGDASAGECQALLKDIRTDGEIKIYNDTNFDVRPSRVTGLDTKTQKRVQLLSGSLVTDRGTEQPEWLPDDGLAAYTELWVPAAQIQPAAANGCAAMAVAASGGSVDIQSLNFDQTTQEYAQFSVVMPRGWDKGTVDALFYWSHPAATAYGVVWSIESLALDNDDAIGGAFGTAVTVTDTGGTTDDLYTSGYTGEMTIGGTPSSDDMSAFQVSRVAGDGSDTLDGDARLQGVKLRFKRNYFSDE